MMAEHKAMHACAACGVDQPKSNYNTAQWKKGSGVGRCKSCAAAAATMQQPMLPTQQTVLAPGGVEQQQTGCRQIDRRTGLTHREFVERYRHKRPVVLCGLANDWKALSRWQDVNHLGSLLDKEVLVLRSPDRRHFLKRTCAHYWGPFDNVAERLFTPGGLPPGERMYARARLEGGLREEVSLDPLEALVGGTVGAHKFNEAKCGVWLGSGGCITPLHYDLCHGFLVGVLGTKHFTYYSPEDFRAIFPRSASHGMPLADALAQDLEQAAQLSEQIDERWRGAGAELEVEGARKPPMQTAEAAAWHAEVRPGDVLYTPPYFWHHVETEDSLSALSVLVPWDPTAEEPAPDCMLGVVKPE